MLIVGCDIVCFVCVGGGAGAFERGTARAGAASEYIPTGVWGLGLGCVFVFV